MPDASREETIPATQQPSDSIPQQGQGVEKPQQVDAEAQHPASERPRQPEASKPVETAQPEQAAGVEANPPASVPKGEKKWVKPLVVAVICVLVLAIVVGAYFVWQTGEKRSIASAAVDQLKGSEAVSGLVIPSEWGDQGGFSVGGVDVDSVECGILPVTSAKVAVKADIDNGHYAGQAAYDIAMRKDGPSWVADDISQTALSYYPVSGISDEVLLARILELVGEAYELALKSDDQLRDPSLIFGAGTTGQVLINAFENFDDNVDIMLEAQYEGTTYREKLSLFFKWVEAGDSPADWRLSSAQLAEDAYMAVSSFPTEGVTLEDGYVPLEEDEWSMSISPELDFAYGSRYAWAFVSNPPESGVDIMFTIELDNGQVIYTSPRIPPNYTLEAIRADELPSKGEYDAVARFRAYEGRTQVGDGTLDTRVIVS